MGLLTYLTEAKIDKAIREIDGVTLTRPALRVADGANVTYGVDVDIGQKAIDEVSAQEVTARLYNVPIAAAGNETIYAEVGAAVRLRRSDTGRWEVVGFSKRKPGTYIRIAVTIPTPTFGPLPYSTGSPLDVGLHAEAISYEDFPLYGGYGAIPYGAIAIFRGGILIEVTT